MDRKIHKTRPAAPGVSSIATVGKVVGSIPVQLGTDFLAHFSEQLYSSPTKAFEELVANSWDAGARSVWIRFPDSLSDSDASVFVLDDGESMDVSGLRILWQVAHSDKRSRASAHQRPIIGKFGIGKLATYVLANKLTYICKAGDGVIRAVTMDYGSIKAPGKKPSFIQDHCCPVNARLVSGN
jgi:Histidine kinase-, DNA gyrase B-, and HSP90-like ATPase